MAYNSADEQAVKARNLELDSETADEVTGLRETMASKNGRKFIWWMLGVSAVGENAFTGNSTTFFNNGKQFVGNALLDRIKEHCFQQYQLMEAENKGDIR